MMSTDRIPDHIQISLVSIMITETLGHHALIFFGENCNTKEILGGVITELFDKTETVLKDYPAYPMHLLPIVMVVNKLDRSPEVLTVIDSVLGDSKVTLTPKRYHFSAISRMLEGAENKRAMALQ